MNKVPTNIWVNYYGKETIDTNTYGKSTGHSGSYSTNYQIAGRELLTPDEVRMLDNKNALLFIRGESPIIDEKYNTFKHPNFKYTEDGGYKPYIHGNTNNAKTFISVADEINTNGIKELNIDNIEDYEILVDDEIDEYLNSKGQTEEK